MKDKLFNNQSKNRDFAFNVSILAGGTIGGQALPVLVSPLLTRLYSPEDFGVLAAFISILMTVSVIASFCYQMAIPLPESEKEAVNVVKLSLILVVFVVFLTLPGIFFFNDIIAHYVKIPSFANYLWLLPIGVLCTGVYQVLNFWCIRTKAFATISKTKLIQSASIVSIQLAGYFLGPVSLIIGRITGPLTGSVLLFFTTFRNFLHIFKDWDWHTLIKTAKRYQRFPIFSSWAVFLNSAGTQLPPLLFAVFFSSSAAGLYMLAHRVLSLPATFLGRAISDVFFSKASEAKRHKHIDKLVVKLHNKLAQIAMPAAVFLFITGPDLFALFFGEEWKKAGEAARWLSPMLYISFIVSPLSRVFVVLEKQIHGLILQIVLLSSRIFALFFVWSMGGDFMKAILFYGSASFFAYFVYLFFIVKIVDLSFLSALTPSMKILPVSLFLQFPVLLAFFFFKNGPFIYSATICSILMTTIFYIFILKYNIKIVER